MIVRPMLLRTVAVLALAAAGVAALSARPAGAQSVPVSAPAIAVPAVSVAVAVRREMVDSLVVSGNLVARQEALVNAEVEGLKVLELTADEGDRVAAGQVLARLSRETIETQLAQNDATLARAEAAVAQTQWQIPQAEASLTEAKAALGRTMALKESGNTTQELIDQRTAAARTAEARLAAARSGLQVALAEKASAEAQRAELKLRLARTEIRSPVAGVVSRRNVRLGAISALSGEPMFRIIANGEVEFEAEVLETQIARLAVGSPVAVTPAGGRAVEGRIRLMPAEIDATTRLGKVRVALPQDESLRVGSFARATVTVARREGVAVPTSAVLFSAGGAQRVQIVKDGRIAERAVKAGIAAGGWTEILEGLAAGEQVVARAGAFLRDGDAVRVADAGTGAK